MSYASDQGVLNAQMNTELMRQCPHVLMRPRVFPDGIQWCALYGDNLMEGVCGFGATPAAACEAFDEAWRESRTPDAIRHATHAPD